MFTGIVEEKGVLERITRSGNSAKLQIRADKVLEGTLVGDSIAVNGICLTVTAMRAGSFTADVMSETLRITTLSTLTPNSDVNLERALSACSRFGGHIVTGHIDGKGRVAGIRSDSGSISYQIRAGREILKYIVTKGSVAIDGVSLTVASVDEISFSLSLIPHTLAETTLKSLHVGSEVNIECDIIAKYTEKLLKTERSERSYAEL